MKYVIFLCLLLLISCKTYHITPNSLKDQLQKTSHLTEKEHVITYLGANLKSLTVIDGKNNPVVLDTAKPIELKVVRKDGFKFKYYLESMSINSNTFSGMGPTYLVGGMIHKVHIDSIQSIKVNP